MTIEQTVEIPASRRLTIDVPPEVPAGKIILAFKSAPINENSCKPGKPAQSWRGILKGRGITLERFKEMRREDKAREDAADER